MLMQCDGAQDQKPGWPECIRVDHDCPLVVALFNYSHMLGVHTL